MDNVISANGHSTVVPSVPYFVRWEPGRPAVRFELLVGTNVVELNLTPQQARETAELLLKGAAFIEDAREHPNVPLEGHGYAGGPQQAGVHGGGGGGANAAAALHSRRP